MLPKYSSIQIAKCPARSLKPDLPEKLESIQWFGVFLFELFDPKFLFDLIFKRVELDACTSIHLVVEYLISIFFSKSLFSPTSLVRKVDCLSFSFVQLKLFCIDLIQRKEVFYLKYHKLHERRALFRLIKVRVSLLNFFFRVLEIMKRNAKNGHVKSH